MTDRLTLYNGGLALCGVRSLASLSENRTSRRELDAVWDRNAVKTCLEMGEWTFGMRSQRLDYSPSVEPAFGYRYAFNKPDDYVMTAAVCQDEYYNTPLTQYADETGFWFSDLDTIFVKFVSNDGSYGNDYANWAESFSRLVEAYLAKKVVLKLTKSMNRVKYVEGEFDKALKVARSKDVMKKPAMFPPQGSWVNSRRGGRIG